MYFFLMRDRLGIFWILGRGSCSVSPGPSLSAYGDLEESTRLPCVNFWWKMFSVKR